ncbi:MAG: DMT family transporter, partial [Deltaproteobacteria bacterium]|nr:DMT family transporter [Deltaproteobacteria bacterium]
MYRAQLRWQPIAILIVLAMIWGANMAFIKIAARELPSLFMAAFRSLVAGLCLFVWMKVRGIPLFPSRNVFFHGVVVGILFGAEFALIYVGLEYTLASRTYVLVFTAPFFVALGAHFLLRDDRLNAWKSMGLILAFSGVVVLFLKDLGPFSLSTLPGDLMALGAGALWGATTIYLKKYLSYRTLPLQTLFYQVLFSVPLLLAMSLVLEDLPATVLSPAAGFSLFYQCIIVAFLSYLAWFELIHRFPVSLLHAFSFFTPVFGVFLSGALMLGEIVSPALMAALVLVCLGMILVNRQPASKTSGGQT